MQFHPTGMIWPPSVRGILVTEGVRGEGGVLKNRDGKRFMFDNIPDNYKVADGRHSRRGLEVHAGRQELAPPARAADARSRRANDRAAKCAAAAALPHGGVFLDIAWIKEKLPNAEEHIKRKLPSMYHQFMQLAGIDITKEPMEIGPTTHYVMGGIRVDGDTQMSTVPGLFACRRVRRRAARRESARRKLAVGSDRVRQARRRIRGEVREVERRRVDRSSAGGRPRRREALAPFDRAAAAKGPYQVQEALQETMQDNVGIVRAQARNGARAEDDRHAQARAPRR